MNLKSRVQEMDSMISKGEIIPAVKEFFADNATTSDYGKAVMTSKEDHLNKMAGFLGSIANVNGITHHHCIVDGNVSASEFTFDFDMKDGSKIYWHEILRRVWNEDGKIIQEEYFDAQN